MNESKIKQIYEEVKDNYEDRVMAQQVIACCFALNSPTFEECQVIGERAWEFWIHCVDSNLSFQRIVDAICEKYAEDDLTLAEIATFSDDDIISLL